MEQLLDSSPVIQCCAVLCIRKGCTEHICDLLPEHCQAHCCACCVPRRKVHLQITQSESSACATMSGNACKTIPLAYVTSCIPLHIPGSHCTGSHEVRSRPPSQQIPRPHSPTAQQSADRPLDVRICACTWSKSGIIKLRERLPALLGGARAVQVCCKEHT